MNNKHVENVVSWIVGIGGGSTFYMQVHWENEIIKFGTAMGTAFLAGVFGWLGQQAIKYYYKKYKIKKHDTDNDFK